ncbi:MAG: rRNA pseudouridine synthase [Ruminococcaceae bacterium]|nr:rRNA pseudouridine synthase [Oscillospiraceae bacterium]
MRLDKLLANCGLGSRKEIKALMRKGAVTVDGAPVSDPATHVDPERQAVTLNGQTVHYREFVYLLLHKPPGYVSATFDRHLPVVTELVPPEYAHFDVFPVGRLDIDTEGLLILTNDGAFSHRVLAPASHVPKTYYARVEGELSSEHIHQFAQGITLDDGYQCLGAELTLLSPTEAQVTIHEGKFHQIKRMFAAVGAEVIYLKRISFGALTLPDDLKCGKICELTEEEIQLAQEEHHEHC